MNSDKHFTVLVDTVYRSNNLAWWMLEVDMETAKPIGFGIYHGSVASLARGRTKADYIFPLTLEQATDFIRTRLIDGDWVDVLLLDGTRLRNMEKVVRARTNQREAL